ncbi:MAG: hypothetical protein HY553_20080 [Elusimicrobia bacterium]|nr:hypothetical protein [Elusimicrobiota bacterium]
MIRRPLSSLSSFLGVDEIDRDARLKMLLAGLLFYFHVTFRNFHGIPAFSTAGTAAFNYIPTWPFEDLRGLIFMSQPWTDLYLSVLATLALGGVLAALAGRTLAAMGLLAFLFPNELYFYLSELRVVHNYYHIHLMLTLMFLISRQKLFFMRVGLLCCYLDAGFAKLTPSWLAGDAFNSVPDKLPLLPKSDGLVVLAGRALIALELLGPFVWFARSRALRLASVAAFLVFHLYSVVIVGFLYPTIMFTMLVPAFLGFDRPLHAGYRFERRHLASWAYAALLVVGGLWSILIPGSVLLTAEGKYFGLFMFEANRGVRFQAVVEKGPTRMQFEVERYPRMTAVDDVEGRKAWGRMSGTIHQAGEEPRPLDAYRVVRDGDVVVWNPQLFSGGDTVVFGDPYLYYFYGKELCRRYQPDRLSLTLESTLNRKETIYPVLAIYDFCGLNPSYNPFWRNSWIKAPPL